MTEERKDYIKDYLAKIRRTVEQSKDLIQQAELRMQETDRFLASQGLTREQVRKMQFTQAQRELVDDELRKRGLPPIDLARPPDPPYDEANERFRGINRDPGDYGTESTLEERQRKFNTFMQEFRL